MTGRRVEIDLLQPAALAATRAAALACQDWIGRGRPKDADAAATEAMRAALAAAPGSGTVVIGEGEKDQAPMLYEGERVGLYDSPVFDIAVDPLEGTDLCANGLPGALATIAFAEHDAMASLGRAFYMDKLVGRAALRGVLNIADAPESNVTAAAEALGKPVEALRVVVLDKPRHAELIERIRQTGARVATPSAGDVAEGLAAGLPEGGADLLMGVGGTPEGVMSACAARALGGFMQGRLAPQDADEIAAVADAGLDPERIYELDDLVAGDGFFVATGVTGGELLRRPWQDGGHMYTESIIVTESSVRRIVEVTHK